jgi:aspartokinase-like uncharacterized kinase
LEQGGGRAVIVPGGGPFADIVRREQKEIGFGDPAAHRMALLGMAQFGFALTSLSPRLKPASSVAAIKRALAEDAVAVWLPLDMLDGHPDVPESWEMTSDSLAAWLAGQLGAARLIFLKRAGPTSLKISDLVSAGVLDPLTPRFLADTKAEAWLCGPRQVPRLGQALAEGSDIGRRIEVA